MNPYYLIVTVSVFIILSYLFGELSKRTNIPSVLLLIVTGIIVGQVLPTLGIASFDYFPMLKILGTVGLIMIVLEGALDLELTKDRLPLIWKATVMAMLGILFSILIVGGCLHLIFSMSWALSMLYATPIAVISSAIVIPSINGIKEHEKEFLVYESCLSDIIGIMVFSFIVSVLQSDTPDSSLNERMLHSLTNFSLDFVLTVVVSIVVSIGLIFLFKFLSGQVKLFLFIAILILMYALGNLMGLSSLVLILVFGLILKNNSLVFRGKLKDVITRMEFKLMERNFHIITRETAFILRTFFFIVFGLSINLVKMVNIKVIIVSVVVVGLIFGVRWVLSKVFLKRFDSVVNYIAPRGLITVLLFYKIPKDLTSPLFEEGLLMWVIVLSSLILTSGLLRYKPKHTGDEIHG